MKQIAIVTGASSGIGRLLALGIPERYEIEELWVIARSEERLNALQNEVKVRVRAFPIDLTDLSQYTSLRTALQEEKPNVKVLVNASGYAKFERFDRISEEDNLGMIDLNCRALTAMTHIVLPYMSEGGIVVNIASMSSFMPIPYVNVYAATKAYVLSFSRALNREMRSRKIKVLAVCPYWTRTAFFDRSNDNAFIKYFDHIYEPEFIVKKTFKAMKKKKDYLVPGAFAKCTHAALKVFPQSVAMKEFIRREKLNKIK